MVSIIVNGKDFNFHSSLISYESAVALAGYNYGTQYTVTYSVKNGKRGSLISGEKIDMIDGMIINVSDTSFA